MSFVNAPSAGSEGSPLRDPTPGTISRPFSKGHKAFILGELITLSLIVILGLLVHLERGPLPGDVALELRLQNLILPHPTLTHIIELASTLNWPNPALIGVVVITLGLLLLRRWVAAFVACSASGLGDASSYLTNQLVQRPRPSGHGITILQQINTYYSFPSGHVVHVIAFFGFILYLTFQTKRQHEWWLWLLRVPLIALIVAIGPSRILEGEHWPSDVLGGVLLGGFWLVAGIHAYHWLHRHSPLRHLIPFSSPEETSQLDRV